MINEILVALVSIDIVIMIAMLILIRHSQKQTKKLLKKLLEEK